MFTHRINCRRQLNLLFVLTKRNLRICGYLIRAIRGKKTFIRSMFLNTVPIRTNTVHEMNVSVQLFLNACTLSAVSVPVFLHAGSEILNTVQKL